MNHRTSLAPRLVTAACLAVVLCACKFPYPGDVEVDASSDATAVDATAVDAVPDDGRPVQHLVTVTVDPAGTGTGTIQIEPGGFTCVTGACMRMYDAGTNLTITATGTTSLDGVASISGDCQASPCQISNLSGDRAVTARFVRYQCVPSTETCAVGVYNQCDATGNHVSYLIPNGALDGSSSTLTMNDYACPMGCHATQSHCADIALGNGIEAALDTPAVSPSGLDLVIPRPAAQAGTASVNTNSFNASAGTIQVTDTDGVQITVPAQLLDQPGAAPSVLVLKTRTFTLRAGTTLRAEGDVALAIASHFDIYVGGTLDLSGDRPPSSVPTGGAGANYASGAACVGVSLGATTGAAGGGGGGCGGGASSTGITGGVAVAVAPPFIIGGCSGGRGNGIGQLASGAGGGLLLASRTKVSLAASAVIDLSGGRGLGGTNYAAGGGGGGVGIVQAPVVRVVAGAIVAGRGGSGGAAGTTAGVAGLEGMTTGTSGTPGQTCAGCGTGGTGGGEVACTGGIGAGSASAIAAGGGAAGSFQLYSRGVTTVPSGTMKLRELPQGTLAPRSP